MITEPNNAAWGFMPMNQISNRHKVYKIRTLLCPNCYPDQRYAAIRPWVAIHPAGNRRFDTWQEAYDYARSPLYTLT